MTKSPLARKLHFINNYNILQTHSVSQWINKILSMAAAKYPLLLSTNVVQQWLCADNNNKRAISTALRYNDMVWWWLVANTLSLAPRQGTPPQSLSGWRWFWMATRYTGGGGGKLPWLCRSKVIILLSVPAGCQREPADWKGSCDSILRSTSQRGNKFITIYLQLEWNEKI